MGVLRAYLVSGIAVALALTTLSPNAVANEDPDAPQDLTIESLGDAVLVSWKPPLEDPVSYYLLERLTSAGLAPPVQLDAQTTEYIDPLDIVGVVGAAYQVTAVYADGSQASAVGAAVFIGRIPGLENCSTPVSVTSYRVSFNGTCPIMAGTEPLPEPARGEVRFQLLWAWYAIEPYIILVCDQVEDLLSQADNAANLPTPLHQGV